jgi:hypothetical protein
MKLLFQQISYIIMIIMWRNWKIMTRMLEHNLYYCVRFLRLTNLPLKCVFRFLRSLQTITNLYWMMPTNGTWWKDLGCISLGFFFRVILRLYRLEAFSKVKFYRNRNMFLPTFFWLFYCSCEITLNSM